jgi:hypothetical protein
MISALAGIGLDGTRAEHSQILTLPRMLSL